MKVQMRVPMKLTLVVLMAMFASTASAATAINGAGATFPFPLYSKWTAEFGKSNDVHINYQSIGSGGGIRQISQRTVDFGASDAPMTDDEMKQAPAKLLHVPTTLGAVVIAYNVAGVATALKLSPEAIAGLFLGTIKKWNDPVLVKLNPGVTLPDADVAIVHRSDGSGTTGVFTDYLAKVSPEWKSKVGAGKSVQWPVGIGAKGNEGVSGALKTQPNTVGYVELAYAVQAKMTFAQVKNHSGAFVTASPESVSAAAAGVAIPEDFRVSIVDAAGATAYPISSFTYILVYEDMADATKGAAVAKFLWWAIHDGQKFCVPLNYSALPAGLVGKLEPKLKALKAGGQPVAL